MDKHEYDCVRLMEFLSQKKQITRANLTRQGLGRFPDFNMTTFYEMVDDLVEMGYLSIGRAYLPGRSGPKPSVYYVTPLGNTWLKQKRRETKKALKALQ